VTSRKQEPTGDGDDERPSRPVFKHGAHVCDGHCDTCPVCGAATVYSDVLQRHACGNACCAWLEVSWLDA